eukprot:TRINITY_DN36225_c0_g1_i1.p1 TRINITY_DN36225_c0_g1~~TRINITY_DN36225_c0_g1_i1.p1  ORF type:complete len:416 (+),score=99.35 TRINITY_DN36225_c0_g1_i1:40-1248(+)
MLAAVVLALAGLHGCSVRRLREWFTGQGGRLHDGLSIVETEAGLGLAASVSIPAGALLYSLPKHRALQWAGPVPAAPTWSGPAPGAMAGLTAVLLRERAAGERGQYSEYIACLPDGCTGAWCLGDALQYTGDLVLASMAERFRKHITELRLAIDWAAVGVEVPSVHDWHWAYGIIMSRAWVSDSESYLVPVADLTNHASGAGYATMGRGGVWLRRARAELQPGSQVYSDYRAGQPTSNRRLMLHWGFSSPEPAHAWLEEAAMVTLSDAVAEAGRLAASREGLQLSAEGALLLRVAASTLRDDLRAFRLAELLKAGDPGAVAAASLGKPLRSDLELRALLSLDALVERRARTVVAAAALPSSGDTPTLAAYREVTLGVLRDVKRELAPLIGGVRGRIVICLSF